MLKFSSVDEILNDTTQSERRKVGRVVVDVSPVENLGEPLSDVWWQGRQWLVTGYGIEARDGRYQIEAELLREKYWLDHMREKGWVDMDDFATAWFVALTLHGRGIGQYGDVEKAIGKFPPIAGGA